MTRILLIAVLAITIALAMVNARLMNKRDHIHGQFELLERTNPEQMHEFRIALKQKNLDILEATLLDVSNPESPRYGKWWTSEQILDLIAPSIDEIKPVVAWLKSFDNGVSEIDVSGRDFIKVKATIRVIEEMFETQMFDYRSRETGKVVSRILGELHVPDSLLIIDMIMGLSELVPKSVINSDKIDLKRAAQQSDCSNNTGVVYPGYLRKLYQIPSEYAVNNASSFGVAKFFDQWTFQVEDVITFNKLTNENVVVSNIVGPFDEYHFGFVSTTNVQFGGAMALNTSFWYWTVKGWMYEFATDLFNAEEYPLVVSMSWGWSEDLQCDITACPTNSTQESFNYVNKVNTEYIKLGLKGVTLLAASGNQGAPGPKAGSTCPPVISNIFPASSPWVTSVGATMLLPSSSINRQSNQPPLCQNYRPYCCHCATGTAEGVCTYPIAQTTSGGGFSQVSPVPEWQKDLVKNYLNVTDNLPTGLFNASNRAYPDVSINGHNYAIFLEVVWVVDGTQGAVSVFGGIVSLFNSYMLNNGKTSLGFVNPLLYKMYAADATTFTDITTGNNYCTDSCCGTTGFVATKGWDPVTGLGTPMFPRIQEYIRKQVVEKK